MNRIKVTDEQIIEASKTTPSARQAALLLGIKYDTYKKHAIRLGCFKKNQSHKGCPGKSVKKPENYFDEHYFDNIDTPEKAYFLGFIAADGSISKNKNGTSCTLRIAIHQRDEHILEDFCYSIGYNVGHISKYTSTRKNKNGTKTVTPVACVSLHSKYMAECLSKYNIVPNKSHIDNSLMKNIDEPFKMSWLAGYIDGDGSISNSNYDITITSNKATLDSIDEFLCRCYDIYETGRTCIGEITYTSYYTKKDIVVKLLIGYLYSTPMHLKRKYNNAESILKRYCNINPQFKTNTITNIHNIHMNSTYKTNTNNICANSIYKTNTNNTCADCGENISHKATRCRSCAAKFREKDKTPNRPSRSELKDMIRNYSFVSIASWYNISDNAIRKWCKSFNLPYRSQDIKSYSDEEWNKI